MGWPGTFSPNNEILVIQRINRKDRFKVDLVLIEAQSGNQVRSIERYTSAVQNALFTPDGKYLLCAAGGDMVNFWEVATGNELWYALCAVDLLALSPDGKTAVTATRKTEYPASAMGPGARLDFWHVKTGKRYMTVKYDWSNGYTRELLPSTKE